MGGHTPVRHGPASAMDCHSLSIFYKPETFLYCFEQSYASIPGIAGQKKGLPVDMEPTAV